jgi:hypothetical protein
VNKSEEARHLEVVDDDDAVQILKPEGGNPLERFKSKRSAALENVETLQTKLPHCRISEARDFVRLHPDEENYWSCELCFVSVPIKGQKRDTMHLILEDLAMQYLPSARIKRFRLALASKPHDVFFLCHVPSQNLDNKFNETSLEGCIRAMKLWTEVTSRSQEGVDEYRIQSSRDPDAFPAPKWPTQPMAEIIDVTFAGCMIERGDHPGLLRLIGARQVLS